MNFDLEPMFRSLYRTLESHWPVGGLALALLVLACCFLPRRRLPRRCVASATASPRRALTRSMRRPKLVTRVVHHGPSVSVLINNADGHGEDTEAPFPARVIDRSIEGLVLESDDRPVANNALLNVRVAGSSPMVPSAMVRVKNCLHTSEGWVLECLFVRTPCYSVRMLFG